MLRKTISLFALVCILNSCNNSADTATTPSDTTSKDNHEHAAATATAPELPTIPDNAKVYFKNLKDGQSLSSPLMIEMGIDDMALDTANGIIKPASGHHHILIGLDSMAAGITVPKDSVHLHYGNAQSTAEIKLPPGTHKLTLQFADALHRSYGRRLTSTVTVTIK
ncbi:MAG: DUF4399 domain-containing protein [Chitinophagaceae bacterium]|nr:DUF4399 domain-containing protein [Chitinophagaceae bacterium]